MICQNKMKNYKKHMDQTKKAYSLVASDFGASRANPWFEFEIYKRNLKPGAKFLDLGCGNARLAKFLPKNIDYLGVDSCKNLLNLAHKLLKETDLYNWKLSLACMTDVFFPKKHFHRIVMVASYHHILKSSDRVKLLNRLYDSLEDGGKVYISVWNLFQKRYFWNMLKSFFCLRPLNLAIPFKGEVRFYHAFTPFALKKEARRSKFKKIKIGFVTHRQKVKSFWACKNMVLKLEK